MPAAGPAHRLAQHCLNCIGHHVDRTGLSCLRGASRESAPNATSSISAAVVSAARRMASERMPSLIEMHASSMQKRKFNVAETYEYVEITFELYVTARKIFRDLQGARADVNGRH
jgi:hypothetical protein